jgi:hypothetical protein
VYKGVSKPLIPKDLSHKYSFDWLHFFGKNGFGDIDLGDSDTLDRSCVVENISAVVALHELTREFKGESFKTINLFSFVEFPSPIGFNCL